MCLYIQSLMSDCQSLMSKSDVPSHAESGVPSHTESGVPLHTV